MGENDVTSPVPERFGPIDLLKKWRWLQDQAGDFDLKGFLAAIIHLWPPPDWHDSASVRAWCRTLIGATEMCADVTPTELDNKAIATLATIVRNDEAWAAFFALFCSLAVDAVLADQGVEMPHVVSADRERGEAIAKVAGIEAPAVIHAATGLVDHAAWLRSQPQTPG